MPNLLYSPKIQKAISLAITTHELDDKQRRKGKEVPYVTHPLAVALILAQAGAKEEVIVAGILHDTVEDSIDEKKITPEFLKEEFGAEVAELVAAVTEEDTSRPWKERKDEALAHIEHFSQDAILVKSADILSNGTELVNDVQEDGEEVFGRFNAPKERTLWHYQRVITALLKRWPENPLRFDLQTLSQHLALLEER